MSREFRSGPVPGWYAFLVLGLFFLGPFAIMLNFSFYHKIPGGLYEPGFELDNYGRLMTPFFGRILLMSTGLCALASLVAVGFGFALTYAISNMSKSGRTFWLILLVSLLSLSEVVTGFAWSTLFSRTAGLGGWLHALGILDAPKALSPGFWALLTDLTFICIPFVVLVLFPPQGFSFEWYLKAFQESGWTSAMATSFFLAFGAALFSLCLAVPLALYCWRRINWQSRLLRGLGLLPFMLPPVVSALGFLVFWSTAGGYGQMYAAVISHGVFLVTLPMVMILIGLDSVDRNLIDAARICGASRARVYLTVMVPIVRPFLISGSASPSS